MIRYRTLGLLFAIVFAVFNAVRADAQGTTTPVVQPGARRHGIAGICGNVGIVEPVTYRI